MRSAYQVLNVPPYANPDDIRSAYQRTMARYTKERLVADPALQDERLQVEEAYRILSTPALREAHDRKLAAPVPIRPRDALSTVAAAPAASSRWGTGLFLGAVLVSVAVGALVQRQSAQEQAAEVQRQEAQHQQMQGVLEQSMADGVARQQSMVESQIRAQELADKERHEALKIKLEAEAARNAANAQLQEAQRIARDEQIRREQAGEDEDVPPPPAQNAAAAAAAAERAKDRERIRNLCRMNYGRTDC